MSDQETSVSVLNFRPDGIVEMDMQDIITIDPCTMCLEYDSPNPLFSVDCRCSDCPLDRPIDLDDYR